jgi:hypothetical protein
LNYGGESISTSANFIVAPSTSAATQVLQSTFAANWSDVGAASYFLDVSTDNFNTTLTGYTNLNVSNVTTYGVTGLAAGTTYQYRVRSSDGTNVSINSNASTVITLPGTPTANAASAVAQNSFTANWSLVSNGTGYYLDVALDQNFNTFLVGFNALQINSVNTTSQLVTGLSPYEKYYYRVRSVNSTGGASPNSNVISVTTADLVPPSIANSSTPNPTTVTLGNTPTFNTIVTDNVVVDTVRIFYRGISKTNFTSSTLQGLNAGGTYSITSQTKWYDSLGMEYYFWAVDEAANKTVTPHSYVRLISPSLTLPALPSGTDQKDYRIVAFPYVLETDNKVTTVYSGVPWNNRTEAGLWWWNSSAKNGQGSYDQYGSPNAFQTIDPGKGYWAITQTAVSPQLSNVTAPAYNRSNLFSMTLKSGWNMIGNPYPVPISWDNVISYNQKNNSVTSISPLSVFDGGYKAATGSILLAAFQGGFVKNLSGSDITIDIPFIGQSLPGGRIAAAGNTLSPTGWNVSLHIDQNDLSNQLGGFGMDPNASIGVDRFDNYNPPQFGGNPEVNFKNESVANNFANDMVNTQDSYTWRFIPSGSIGQSAILSWNKTLAPTGKQLFLLNEELIEVIDMANVTQYQFTITNLSRFSIFYGSNIESSVVCSEISASNLYPNPIIGNGKANLKVSLPESTADYQLNLQVFNSQGQLIQTLNTTKNSGIHELEFSLSPNELSAGIYIYKLSMVSGNSSRMFTGKIVKQ